MGSGLPARSYRGASAEDRRHARRRRLLDAGLACFGTRGTTGTRVRDVCATARLTERYFYESFSNLEALLEAVFDEVVSEAARRALEAAEAAPHDELDKARAALGSVVGFLADDPRRARIFAVEAVGGSDRLRGRRRAAMALWAETLLEQGRAFYGPDAVPDQDARLSALAMVGATSELLGAWLAGHLDVDRGRLVEHCARLHVAAARVRSE